MLYNTTKLILRGFRKKKSYSIVNVLGLSIGLTSFILISLFVGFELSYDRFHTDHESIYRIYTVMKKPTGAEKVPFTADPLVPEMQLAWPQIESYVRAKHVASTRVTSEEQSFYEEGAFFVDKNFFEFFDFDLSIGDKSKVLDEPFSAVISSDLAKRYFGNSNPVGKVIKVERDYFDPVEYTVKGVSGPIPKNSHIQYDLLLSFESSYHKTTIMMPNDWFWTTSAYLKLGDKNSIEQIEEGMPEFIKNHNVAKNSPMGSADFSFTALSSLHTSDVEVKNDYAKKQSIQHILLFSGVALLVLFLAIINYVNLAIVKSMEDSKRIGIQKVLGASRIWLIKRHVIESLIYCFMAVVLSLVTIEAVLKGFNQIVDSHITVPYGSPVFIGGLLFLILGVGVTSGIYPAIYLSKFKVVESLKESFSSERSKPLRVGLVTFQFLISQGLIVASLIIYSQLAFMMKPENSGLAPESVMVVPLHDMVDSPDLELLRNQLAKNSGILNTSGVSPAPGVDNYQGGVQGKQLSNYTGDPKTYFSYRVYDADYQFKETVGLELVEGRWYDSQIKSDLTNAVIINETAAKHFGWGAEALGQTITKYDSTVQYVIGIARDFHTESFQYPIQPAVFNLQTDNHSLSHLLVKFRTDETSSVLTSINQEWDNLIQTLPFDYYFMDDYFESQYTSELKLNRLIISLSVLAVLIAILGVYGLTSFTIHQRTKEVGIRKILGASIKNILSLLIKPIFMLIMLGFMLAVPIAYYFSNEWLTGYAYRIEVSPWLFAIALLSMLSIAILATSSIMYKSVRKNPVDSLRAS